MKPVLQLLSPAGPSARLSTLIFHRVLPTPDPVFPEEMHAERFKVLCDWLRDWFNVLPLDEALKRLDAGTLPARALTITFDDGYADNQEVAAPLLQAAGLPCTFFVATGFLDGGCMWNDIVIQAVRQAQGRQVDFGAIDGVEVGSLKLPDAQACRAAINSLIGKVKYLEPAKRLNVVRALAARAGLQHPQSEMMSSRQVADLAARGFGIGGHTVNHPILARLDEAEARREIGAGREQLEAITGQPVRLFAYPNGKPGEDYSADSVRIVRSCGFDAAVSTAWGSATAATDRFQIPRFTPWDQSRWPFALRMLGNLRRDGALLPLAA